MRPRVVLVDPSAPDPHVIEEAASFLRLGSLVAFPTETVYGLGALAADENAVRRIFEAKGRPPTHPLIVHVEDALQAREVTTRWTEREADLARRFWPGPLTLVVPKADSIPRVVTGGGDTVAVRAPAHPVARALLRAVGAPVAAPSANRYQTISPTTAAHVVKSLAGKILLVLDGGPCEAGIESTVLDVSGSVPKLLRPGVISLEALRAVLGTVEVASELVEAGMIRSPGMDVRHYAPRAPVFLAPDDAAASQELEARCESGERVGLLARARGLDVAQVSAHVVVLEDDPLAYARGLYSALHALDDAGVDRIIIAAVPAGASWDAVRDRLRRAAGGGSDVR